MLSGKSIFAFVGILTLLKKCMFINLKSRKWKIMVESLIECLFHFIYEVAREELELQALKY